jgi:hypothetical protein
MVSVGVAVTRPSPVTSATEAEIVRRYHAGDSPARIGQALGLGAGVVRRVLKRLAVPPRPKCPVSGPHEQAILSMHAEGRTIKDISGALGLPFVTVYRVLPRHGMEKKR